MQNTYIENTVSSLGEFFAEIGLPLEESEKMSADIVELALTDMLGKIAGLIPPEDAPAFSSLLDSPEQTEEQRLALFWEKAIVFLGKDRASEIFAASLEETLDGYMESLKNRFSPAQKDAVKEFKLQEIKMDIEKTLG